MAMLIRKTVRFNEETIRKAESLIENHPKKYPNISQLIRSSIHYTFNKRNDL